MTGQPTISKDSVDLWPLGGFVKADLHVRRAGMCPPLLQSQMPIWALCPFLGKVEWSDGSAASSSDEVIGCARAGRAEHGVKQVRI